MNNQVGRYRGVDYKRQRICDILAVDCEERWFFTYDNDGAPTGSHYRTLYEMREHIDRLTPPA